MQTSSFKLEKAYNLVYTHWFPYDQSILRELDSKAKEGANKEELLSILKKDSSLFLLCLKEVLSAPSVGIPGENSPAILKFIENASLDQIRQSIEAIKKRPISHGMGTSTDLQKQRLSEMIVSSQTADKLTEGDRSINEVAYSCALMRQLGLTLIAWNYPRIFEKVTSKSQSRDSLDSYFSELLGFSPIMLAATVLEKWGFPKPYIEAVGDRGSLRKVKPVDPIMEYRKELFSRVSNICAVGEALARATNPTLYNTAEEDMELASEYIESFLGKEGVIQIISSARENLKTLSLDVPPLFLAEAKNELDINIKNKIKGTSLFNKNPYLGSLPSELFNRVSKLYHEVIPNSPTYSAVSLYAKEIFPITGISSLHVYLFDPFERKLYPSLVLGKSKLLTPKNVYLKSVSGQHDILTEALKTKMPIKHTQFIKQSEEITVLACSLGEASTVGVVYMELVQSEYEKIAVDTELDSLKYFKALKILLSDCLGL